MRFFMYLFVNYSFTVYTDKIAPTSHVNNKRRKKKKKGNDNV